MAFNDIITPFTNVIIDQELENVIIGTKRFVEFMKTQNLKVGGIYIEEDKISLIIDPLPLSSLLYGKQLPDAVDTETKYKSLFYYILHNILKMDDSKVSNFINHLERHFNMQYKSTYKEQINSILPYKIIEKVKTISKTANYSRFSDYLPIQNQKELEEYSNQILRISRMKTADLSDLIITGNYSEALTKIEDKESYITSAGRVKRKQYVWPIYRELLTRFDSIPDDLVDIMSDLQAKVMSSQEPFSNIRSDIVSMYQNLNLEKYLGEESIDYDDYIMSIKIAASFDVLWFYAVKMKGLIFELISHYYLSNIYQTNIPYKAEQNKLKLSQILGHNNFEQLRNLIATDFKNLDPTPDFFSINMAEDGHIIYHLFEVGWWTDDVTKKTTDEEKWKPFIETAKLLDIDIKLTVITVSSVKMNDWPEYILNNDVFMSWVKTSKTVFGKLHLGPNDELEIELSIVSSSEFRSLLGYKSKVYSPILTLEVDDKKNDIITHFSNYEGPISELNPWEDYVKETFKNKLTKSLNRQYWYDDEIMNMNKEIIVDYLYEQSKNNINNNFKLNIETFGELSGFSTELTSTRIMNVKKSFALEEEKLEVEIVENRKEKEFKIIKLIQPILNSVKPNTFTNTNLIDTVESQSFIDQLLRVKLPGRTSRQKNFRKLFSKFVLMSINLISAEAYVDRLHRVCETRVAYQDIGGKISEKTIKYSKEAKEFLNLIYGTPIDKSNKNLREEDRITRRKIASIQEVHGQLTKLILDNTLLSEENNDELDKFIKKSLLILYSLLKNKINKLVILLFIEYILLMKNVIKAIIPEDNKIILASEKTTQPENKLLLTSFYSMLVFNWDLITLVWAQDLTDINEWYTSYMTDVYTSYPSSIRPIEHIKLIHKALGHEEDDFIQLKDRLIGKGQSRNNPSIKLIDDEIYSAFEQKLELRLSKFGVISGNIMQLNSDMNYHEIYKLVHKLIQKYPVNKSAIQQKYEGVYITDSMIQYINTEIDCLRCELNLLEDSFRISKSKLDKDDEFFNMEEVRKDLILRLFCYEEFVSYLFLSVIAKAHLITKNKYNGLKEQRIPSLNAILYVMQPHLSRESTTPCVIFYKDKQDEYVYEKVMLDFNRSKLWLTLPTMIVLTASELLQEYGVLFLNVSQKKFDLKDLLKIRSINYERLEIYLELFSIETSQLINYFKEIVPDLKNDEVSLKDLIYSMQPTKIHSTSAESLLSYNSSKSDDDESMDSAINLDSDIRILVGNLLFIGILNFMFRPSIYNSKLNNEFRQALRYVYASPNSFISNTKLGKKFSHITRYSELYLDKLFGMMSITKDLMLSDLLSSDTSIILTGPCYLGFLPVVNERVLTTIMFICHIYNKTISNYDEALLKTIDGLFTIPCEFYENMDSIDLIKNDLCFAINETPLFQRLSYIMNNEHTNMSYAIDEALELGFSLLRNKLQNSPFKGLENSKGLHNNFLDIAEVTNCINKPLKDISLDECFNKVNANKYNKILKFAAGKRSKLEDQSYVDKLIKLSDELLSQVDKKVRTKLESRLQSVFNAAKNYKKRIEIDFNIWESDIDNEVIISSFKKLLSYSNKFLKNMRPSIFKDLNKLNYPDHINYLSNIYKMIDLKELIPLHDELMQAENEMKVVYDIFEDVKNKVLTSSKYTSQVAIKNAIRLAETDFRERNSKAIQNWFKFLIFCAPISPIAILSALKQLSVTIPMLTDKDILNFNFNFISPGPQSYPNLTRYISGCICGRVKLSETNFTQTTTVLNDDIARIIKTYYHNYDDIHLFSELCNFYVMISLGNWKTGQRLLNGWKNTGLPRSARSKVIFECIRTSNMYNSHNVSAVAIDIIRQKKWRYFAGVAPKAQLGGLRDLLVQDFESKIVLHISEQLALSVLECLDNDILGHPKSKDIALARITEMMTDPITSKSVIFICGDKKKWAQKHSTLFFHRLIENVFKSDGWKNYWQMVMLEGLRKQIEIPSCFTEGYIKRSLKDNGDKSKYFINLIIRDLLGKKDIPFYHKCLLNSLLKGRNYIELFSHMGQGIHHKFSSLYGHAAELFAIEICKQVLLKYDISVDVNYWRSSDDYIQIINFMNSRGEFITNYNEKKELINIYFYTYVNCMYMFNIRESEKTVVTSRFGEIYSTYANTQIIPAPFKFYIPNTMVASSFTPLDIWRSRFAKMQQMFDNGTSLLTCYLFAKNDTVTYSRLLPPNFFNNKLPLPNHSIDVVPTLSDIVFGTISNAELKIMLKLLNKNEIKLNDLLHELTLSREMYTKKSVNFELMENPQESILTEPYRLPFSIKYERMKDIVNKTISEATDVTGVKSDVLRLLGQSSRLDSSIGEDYRFYLALHSKNIIWGLSGGTRDESISMFRQIMLGNYYKKEYYEAMKIKDNEPQTDFFKSESDYATNLTSVMSNITVRTIYNKIIKETLSFDRAIGQFRIRYLSLRSISAPMRKVNHWYATNNFTLFNRLEQIIAYLLDPKEFIKLRPRLKSPEMVDNDVEKVLIASELTRSQFKEQYENDKDNLLLKINHLNSLALGHRSTIMILHADDEWRDIPKSAIMYNLIHHWVFDPVSEYYYPSGSISKLIQFTSEILSFIAHLSCTDDFKRKLAKNYLTLDHVNLPKFLNLQETILSYLIRISNQLKYFSKERDFVHSILSMLLDNLGDTTIEIEKAYEQKLTQVTLITAEGHYVYNTIYNNLGYLSIISHKSKLAIKTDILNFNFLGLLLDLVRNIKKTQKLPIEEAINYILVNYDLKLVDNIRRIYHKNNYANDVEIYPMKLQRNTFYIDNKNANLHVLYSRRENLRSYKVSTGLNKTVYLEIDSNSWRKYQTVNKFESFNKQAVIIKEAIESGTTYKVEDTKLVSIVKCLQWISTATLEFIIKHLQYLCSKLEHKLDIKVLPKLRVSQFKQREISDDFNLDKILKTEDFLITNSSYMVDEDNNKLIKVDKSSNLTHLFGSPRTSIEKIVTEKKLPSFVSPYFFCDYTIERLQSFMIVFFRGIMEDINFYSICIIISVLKRISPELTGDDLSKKLINKYYNYLFDLSIYTNIITIIEQGSEIQIKMSIDSKKTYKILDTIYDSENMKVSFDTKNYIVLIIDRMFLNILPFQELSYFVHKDRSVTLLEFVTYVLNYAFGILFPLLDDGIKVLSNDWRDIPLNELLYIEQVRNSFLIKMSRQGRSEVIIRSRRMSTSSSDSDYDPRETGSEAPEAEEDEDDDFNVY